MRYFIIQGDALTPQRFWGIFEILSKTELLRVRRSSEKGKLLGYIKKIPNSEVENHSICIMNKIKKI